MPNRERILIVEDDTDTLAALFSVLTQAGHSVLTANDGQQAIDFLERGIRPRLILIDLMLPKVSGYQLVDYLRADPDLKTIPTIVITGVPKDQVRVIADVVLHKPLDFAALVRTVHSYTDQPH